MDTVTLTIDGQQVTVPKGTSVLQAAIENGIKVPYYCYHPGLGVDGNCRVCLVKIEKMPKLQVSCSVTATEGMVVDTVSPEVVEARAGVFEFLLINHPLDCPVCDKGGECPLQDFSYSFGPRGSRMEFPRRTFDGEGVKADVDFGPTLMLNRNRCILCTRCVRFMREIDGDAQIGIVDRGYGSEIATFEERGIHSVLSGNLMDVCPVGAITTRDYRFKSRPWDNPNAVDTDLHVVREGLQHDRVDQGEARVGQGVADDPHDAAVQPGRQRLLDVRHRSVRRITGSRGRRVSCSPSRGTRRAQQAPVAWADAIAAAAAHLRSGGSPDQGPALGARVARRDVRGGETRPGIARRRRAGRRGGDMDLEREAAAGQLEIHGARNRCAQCRRGPRAWPRRGHASRARPGRVADGDRGRTGRCRVRVPPGSCRGAGRPRLAHRRAEGRPGQASGRPGRGREPAHAGRRRRPARGDVAREGRGVHQMPVDACSRPRRPSSRSGTPATTGRSSSISQTRWAPRSRSHRFRPSGRRSRRCSARIRTVAGITALGADRPRSAANWLQASNPSERWKWDFLFQDLPPVKFHNLHAAGESAAVIPLKPVR